MDELNHRNVLEEMHGLYLYDWRENDDDQNTAGWRYEGYFNANGEIFDKLIKLGLVETQLSAAKQRYIRISQKGITILDFMKV